MQILSGRSMPAVMSERERRGSRPARCEHILREIRRRSGVVGAFSDGQSAVNLAAGRLRHIAGAPMQLLSLMRF